jgi:hypothetical protein
MALMILHQYTMQIIQASYKEFGVCSPAKCLHPSANPGEDYLFFGWYSDTNEPFLPFGWMGFQRGVTGPV